MGDTDVTIAHEEEAITAVTSCNYSDIEENKNTCQLCGYQATCKSSLMLHAQIVHDGRKYQCKHCNYQTNKKSHLTKHQQSLQEGRKYECDKCEYQESQKWNLTVHKQSVHKG